MTRLTILATGLGFALSAGLAGTAHGQEDPVYPEEEGLPPPDDYSDIPGEEMSPPEEPQPDDVDPDDIEPPEPIDQRPVEEPPPPTDAPTTVIVPAEPVTEPDRGRRLIGTSISVGGGLTTFTDEEMRDVTDPGGSWEARLVVGTRARFALEAAYTGSAQNIEALGLDDGAALISNGFQGLARANLLTGMWQPYLAAGIGWRRYDLMNEDFNTSNVEDDDNVVEIPVAAGLAFRNRGLVVDLRTMAHVAFQEDLVRAQVGADNTPNQHTWGVQLAAGWEF